MDFYNNSSDFVLGNLIEQDVKIYNFVVEKFGS